MMGLPPSDCGGVHDTTADASPGLAETAVGGSGRVAGTTGVDEVDTGPVPTAFVAVTVNVYAVPFVKPVTVALGAVALTEIGV